ncbi:DUF559 domain-containing protein [Blastococcus sp. CT_GayMR16]|uniref:DUF559 domain-containing protein n=1 Tax=Blastococcus sp. CT_GayMR16 TaxID=2559607 RepID=UPI00107415DB|nr:DUF559 domain-containing protein [Blastococcus sp. CT_GayMR16]TFV89987.1 DUF559 domain-containing protein [Blastococcus sp. CT_GayMR16]
MVTQRQLKTGIYRRLLRNVYADPGLVADHQLRSRAAALLMPSDAVLGGRSAATWQGAPFASPMDAVLVLIPNASAWRGPSGVHVHRTTVDPVDVTTLADDTRITSPVRTAWDLAALETVPTAVAALDGMVRSGHLDVDALRHAHASSRGRWRASRVAKVLPLVDGRSESPPESWVRVACARSGLPAPVPQFVVVDAGGFVGRVDLAWPEHRLIVEYEGAYHFDELQIHRDDSRYKQLVAAGWRVIRLSAADLRDMDTVIARIAHMLAQPLFAG